MNQKQKVLGLLKQYKGRRISFRVFFYKGITQPGTRSSELRQEGYNVINAYYYENKIKKSYYSLNPIMQFENAKKIKSLINHVSTYTTTSR